MAAQFFFMAKGIGNIPFFLYHMYSKDHQPVDSMPVYLIKSGDTYLNYKTLSNREEEILMNSVSYYCKLLQNKDEGARQTIRNRFQKLVSAGTYDYVTAKLSNDSMALARFPTWWAGYFKTVMHAKQDSVSVVRSYVYSKNPFNKSANDSLIFSVKLK